jgi:hypothetical protein
MENFGDRLSVDDIWRLAMFIKTIPNHTLKKNRVPEPKDYIVWQPPADLVEWLKTKQPLTANPSFDKAKITDPYMEQAMRVFPGLAPSDSYMINDGKTVLSLQDAADGIRTLYNQLLDRAWSDAVARGEKLPPLSQKSILPTVPGQE